MGSWTVRLAHSIIKVENWLILDATFLNELRLKR